MEFLKILWNNLRKGPVTDPFPAGPTVEFERIRGQVELDSSLCVGCGTCRHVCTAGAINIAKNKNSFDVVVWHNACCRCAQCAVYCPTGAIKLTPNWHSAHLEGDKYKQVAEISVKYAKCSDCGANIRVLPPKLQEKCYATHPEVDVQQIVHLCPACRRKLQATKDAEAAAARVAAAKAE